MKKLLVLTQGYPFTCGEATFLEPELTRFAERFAVRIASCYPHADADRGAAIADIPATDVMRGGVLPGFAGVLTDHNFYRELLDALTARGGARLIYKRAGFIFWSYLHAHRYALSLEKTVLTDFLPDVCYSLWAREPAYALLLLKKRHRNIRAAVRLHGYDLYEERTKELWQPFRRALSRDMDLLAFVSRQGLAYYESRPYAAGVARREVYYLGSVDGGTRVEPNSERFVIVSCGRAMPVKRIDRIIDALAKIDDVPVDWHHIGDGAELPALRARAEAMLGNKKNVRITFCGRLENAAIAPYYRGVGAHLFLNVSESEGLPVSIMEALSVGVPAMATNVGGVSEIVTPDTGVLLESNASTEQIARALLDFFARSEAEKRRLSDGALRLWERAFDADKNAERFAAALAELAEGAGD